LRRQKVVVREWFDGGLSIWFKGKDLEYKEVETLRPKLAVRVFAMKSGGNHQSASLRRQIPGSVASSFRA